MDEDDLEDRQHILGYLTHEFLEAMVFRKREIAYPFVDLLQESKGIKLKHESESYQWLSHEMCKGQAAILDYERDLLLGGDRESGF